MTTIYSALTAPQQRALALLVDGQTTTAAAQACGLHRTTIHHWRRTNVEFALALHDAQTDRADHWRTATQARAEGALHALDTLLADPKTPAGVRLKAILHILQTATALPAAPPALLVQPPQPDPAMPLDALLADCTAKADAAMNMTLEDLRALYDNEDHHDEPAAAPSNEIHHISSPIPTTARNAKCPCQSGRKYKQCCLNKSKPTQTTTTPVTLHLKASAMLAQPSRS